MAVVNTWSVSQLDAYPEAEGHSDVVFGVHWRLDGVDGEHAGSVYGSQAVSVDPESPFTPYADLTQEQVISWVKNAMGEEQVTVYEQNVAEQINNKIAPPVVTPPLPWSE